MTLILVSVVFSTAFTFVILLMLFCWFLFFPPIVDFLAVKAHPCVVCVVCVVCCVLCVVCCVLLLLLLFSLLSSLL